VIDFHNLENNTPSNRDLIIPFDLDPHLLDQTKFFKGRRDIKAYKLSSRPGIFLAIFLFRSLILFLFLMFLAFFFLLDQIVSSLLFRATLVSLPSLFV